MNNDKLNKPFSLYELQYQHLLFEKYSMPSEISREIILYGREINNGLMIYWFLDAVVGYAVRNNARTVDSVKTLIDIFHQKYIVPFGK